MFVGYFGSEIDEECKMKRRFDDYIEIKVTYRMDYTWTQEEEEADKEST